MNISLNEEDLSLKNSIIKTLLLLNYILAILFIGRLLVDFPLIQLQNNVPIFIGTLLLIDITYIASCNIKENKILFLFCGLLVVDSWYLLVASRSTSDFYFQLLSSAIFYLSIEFCFLFIFQGYHYKFKKAIDFLLIGLYISTTISAFISPKCFACFFALQVIGSIFCFFYVILYHWKRMLFFIRNERNSLGLSLMITLTAFIIYYFATQSIKNPIGNFGMYLVILIFSISIHAIIFKESNGIPLSAIFNKNQQLTFITFSIGLFGVISLTLHLSLVAFLLMVHIFFALVFLCNILLEKNLKENASIYPLNSNYTFALEQLHHEETLKAEFATFLHDDILQDLLSIKNMLGNAHHPEIQNLIYETLYHLNQHIRLKMQDYHPILLKNLTIKENFATLIKGISESFSYRSIQMSFICSDTLFIAEPYDILMYRFIKELVTNVYKHSNGNQAWVMLSLTNNTLQLSICDNGTTETLTKLQQGKSTVLNKGLSSIKEQVDKLGGTLTISQSIGTQITIKLLMRGDVSYKHFIN